MPQLKLCLQAIADTMPLAVAVIPWGILTVALGIQIGLSPWQAQAMSLLVFGGAAQLSGLTLMAGTSSLAAILGSTTVVSCRHLLYSVIFRDYVLNLPLRWRLAIGFLLTDEMFVVSEAHTRRSGSFSPLYAVASGFAFYLVWNSATFLGIVAGDTIDNLDQLGLDFAIAATFIAMTFGQIKQIPVVFAIVVSGALAVFLKPFFSSAYIIIASLAGMAAAFAAHSLNNKQ